jgi:hypothetical protein
VARAAEGTFEHDDLSRSQAPDVEVAASRKMAGRIRRQTLMIGVLAAAAGAASSWIR